MGWRGRESQMEFYRRMAYACARIPCGRVASYGQIALLCGMPKNARQVGYALREGRAGAGVPDHRIPAHRIVNARGILSGAAAFESPGLQKLLLEQEGIQVEWTKDGWKVDLRRFGWHNTMEEAEELYRVYQREGI